MKKIKKYLKGNVLFPGLSDLSVNWQTAIALKVLPVPLIKMNNPLYPGKLGKQQIQNSRNLTLSFTSSLGGAGILAISGVFNDKINSTFGDSELGRNLGTLFSSGLNGAGNTVYNNILKKTNLIDGLSENVGASLAGAGSGIAANYIGLGISSLGGNSMLSKGIGLGIATGLGTVGGQLASNIGSTSKGLFSGSGLFGETLAGTINPYALGALMIGSGLSAAFGPSKEYGGKYGHVTLGLDTAYDAIQGAVGFIPGYGQGIAAALALNKGLSNIFGSTSGMTTQDAILGSAFMPAPVKWLNMAGAKTTGTFNNLSWQNSERTNTFMGNAFGNLGKKFDQAREEAGKTYGTFSRSAKNRAQRNIDFANNAWNQILAMTDLDEIQKIRSLYMTSINNLRYAQMIQGGWSPLAIGKQGMKIFNNAINHNMGMRLLSAAALIDNKQMILSALTGTKLYGAKKFRAMSEEELRNRKPEVVISQTAPKTPEELNAEWERTHPNGGNADPNLSRVSNLTTETFNQTTKPPFTGQEYLEAAEAQRQKKIDKFHEAEKIGEAALMADLAVSATPLLQRSFRWAFDKAGNLVRVPIQRTNLFLTSPYTGKWTLFGNREYRFKPGYAAMNGAPVESKPILELVRIGDVIINDPLLAYRQGYKGAVEHFRRTGQLLMNTNGANTLHPEFSQGKLFYGVGNSHQYPDLFVTSEKLQYASPSGKLLGFDPPKPNKLILQLKPGWTSNTRAAEPGQLNFNNVKAYTWEDGYGYREVPLGKRDEMLQITEENAANITPEQWNAAQDAAIARGDMVETQRLRDLHADVNGYNSSLSLYHGSPEKFNEFKAVPNFEGYTDYLSHFSVNPGTSSKFGDVRRFYTNIKNPLRVTDQGPRWNPSKLANELGIQPKYVKDPLEPYWREFQNIKGRGMYKEANRKFMEDELKGDAYIYNNTVEGGGDSYAIPTSRQVKLADAVTYDDKGVRIPLGDRDNFKLNDIRYSWLPLFLGGSTATTLYNKSK